MIDVLSKEQRRLNMSRIRGRDTKPEMLIRQGLHAMGLRYRLYDRKLPGRPDLVFSRFRAVIFIHGCFWHGHNCPMFKLPSTRQDFWRDKILSNRARDVLAAEKLLKLGWRVANVWECSLRGPNRLSLEIALADCHMFLMCRDIKFIEITGTQADITPVN
jgi:DNA mismatch endonuclease (patch repair protein)